MEFHQVPHRSQRPGGRPLRADHQARRAQVPHRGVVVTMRVSLKSLAGCALALSVALCPALSQAEEKPLWEAGLGVGAVTFPDYRGSDQANVYPLPLPYFIYRGKFLKADREGL